jgi:hypothetical protein
MDIVCKKVWSSWEKQDIKTHAFKMSKSNKDYKKSTDHMSWK